MNILFAFSPIHSVSVYQSPFPSLMSQRKTLSFMRPGSCALFCTSLSSWNAEPAEGTGVRAGARPPHCQAREPCLRAPFLPQVLPGSQHQSHDEMELGVHLTSGLSVGLSAVHEQGGKWSMLSDKLLCSDKTARLGLPARGRSLAHGHSEQTRSKCSNKPRKGNKRRLGYRGEEGDLPLFLDFMRVCVDNCSKSTRKLSGLISEFSKLLANKCSVEPGRH